MKIFDCFMYFDEDLVLDLRLNILNNFVNKFIIIEAEEDHQGNKRELKFDIKKFSKFSDKINYIPLKTIILDKSLSLKKNWHIGHLRDQSMRNSIKNYLEEANENDWIIISDLDEIPNPRKFSHFNEKFKFAFFEQNFFNYKFNMLNKSTPKWYGSRICVKKFLKSPQWLRNIKIKERNFLLKYIYRENYHIIKDGGWHFSDIKTPRELIQKISSFAHGELNQDIFKNEEIINKKIENLKDIFDRPIKYEKVIIDKDFPDYFVENKHIYQNWII